uniref:CCHC-type domain-containing protein n=1 Tax=Chromera velia CCMP2878 TaxID=1169474 RepID=A0A0G4FBW7_9ALVE|eukprot:Cvel_16223.t1-p1 / transcript=Cvel_16223.t1 / gene=Cvel_16223 / organism=Chromera_velia_CCMP2878 / gene_product=hypothetical protein / transcript_product=hypothetical protein / location=Cvel_scaffold1240:16471-16728(-) / protein_length=86 / sequence_SO=supercontig / SO=protein_coding / is_pseudo=false
MAGVADHRRRRGLQGGTKSKSRPNRFPADKVEEDNEKRCYHCNQTQPYECLVKPDDKCNKCGKKNHWSAACRKAKARRTSTLLTCG